MSFQFITQYFLSSFRLLFVIQNVVLFHADRETFGQSTALAKASRLDIDVTLGLEKNEKRSKNGPKMVQNGSKSNRVRTIAAFSLVLVLFIILLLIVLYYHYFN